MRERYSLAIGEVRGEAPVRLTGLPDERVHHTASSDEYIRGAGHRGVGSEAGVSVSHTISQSIFLKKTLSAINTCAPDHLSLW